MSDFLLAHKASTSKGSQVFVRKVHFERKSDLIIMWLGGCRIMKTVQPIKDKDKIDAIKKILRASSLRNELLFVLGINTGLRISDILALKVADVSTIRGVVDRLELLEKKTKKKREIALSKKTCRLIESYLEKERPAACCDEPVFRSQKGGKAISRQHAYAILNNAARSVGITERIGTHSLRKTFGYFAYKQGIDLAMIQKLLNHSSQTETLRYIGITQEQMDEVVLKLDL